MESPGCDHYDPCLRAIDPVGGASGLGPAPRGNLSQRADSCNNTGRSTRSSIYATAVVQPGGSVRDTEVIAATLNYITLVEASKLDSFSWQLGDHVIFRQRQCPMRRAGGGLTCRCLVYPTPGFVQKHSFSTVCGYLCRMTMLRSSTQIESPKTLAHWTFAECVVAFVCGSVTKLKPLVASWVPSCAANGEALSAGPV